MAKTTAELAASKAGSTAETNGFGGQERPSRPGGVYRLKDKEGNVVDEQIVKVHPLFGDSQAAAFVRVGYEYVRPAEPGEVKEIEVDPAFLATTGNHAEDTKGIQARLSALESEGKKKDEQIAALLAERESVDNSPLKDEVQAESVKAEATNQVADREESDQSAPADSELRPDTADAKSEKTNEQSGSEAGSAQNDKNVQKSADPAANTNTNVKKAGK
jgi:hypothetical protein